MDDIVTDVNEGWSEEGSTWLPTIQWVSFFPFLLIFFLSFDMVEQLTDCVWAGLKGVTIISGRRSVLFVFLKSYQRGLMKG